MNINNNNVDPIFYFCKEMHLISSKKLNLREVMLKKILEDFLFFKTKIFSLIDNFKKIYEILGIKEKEYIETISLLKKVIKKS